MKKKFRAPKARVAPKNSLAAGRPMVGVIPYPTTLAKGEDWAGIMLKEGKPHYHLIVMAGEHDGDHADCEKKAIKQGGDLPTKREGRLLEANANHAFKKDRSYWLKEQRAAGSVYAWVQTFDDGNQNFDDRTDRRLARAVRREFITN